MIRLEKKKRWIEIWESHKWRPMPDCEFSFILEELIINACAERKALFGKRRTNGMRVYFTNQLTKYKAYGKTACGTTDRFIHGLREKYLRFPVPEPLCVDSSSEGESVEAISVPRRRWKAGTLVRLQRCDVSWK